MSYTRNDFTVIFEITTTPPNASQKGGVVYSRTNRPAHGSEADQKMAEELSKNQYSKFQENKSSLKDILNLEESHGLDENI